MDENRIVEELMLFGLSRQEASIYVCLCRNGAVTGYEAAKFTGISRSNVYNALAGLTEKGAACLLEGSSSRYMAVPVAELCDNKLRLMETARSWLEEHLPAADEPCDGYITIRGEQQILDKMHHMMAQAEMRIYLSASGRHIAAMENEIRSLLDRNIKVVLLTDAVPAGLKEATAYRTEGKENQVRLITDSRYVLTGELTGSRQDICLYSGQRVFVDALKEAMRNEILLIGLTHGRKEQEGDRADE